MPSVTEIWIAALLALGLGLVVAGCSDDFGTPCQFPASPEIAQFCGTEQDEAGNTSTATCVDPLNADCNNRLCVRFQGSDAFCSERCSTDGGCPGGSSCQFPLGQSIGVCVPNRLIQ